MSSCDVDDRQAKKAREEWPKAKYMKDYRIMLDKDAKGFDAVIVNTADHMHAPFSNS